MIVIIMRSLSNETKIKISESLKKYNPPYTRQCPKCTMQIEYKTRGNARRAERLKQSCKACKVHIEKCRFHYSNMGKKSVKSQSRRSKNEIYFSELCKSYFEHVLCNAPIFNGWDADVILSQHKIAILWNGKWHYEKLTKQHSLSQVQTRDNIKLDEIKNAGYTPYIIKDDGKYNRKFVDDEFEKLKIFVK